MFFYALTGLVNAITSTFLGLFVLLKNPKIRANQIFALFCLTVSVWSYSYYFWQMAEDAKSALFWSRVLMAGAIFIPITYLHFILVWLNKVEENKKILIFGYIIFFFFFLINFSSLFIKGVRQKLNFDFWPDTGSFYHPFLLIWFFYAIYSIFLLFKNYSVFTGIKKEQIKYLLTGITIGYLGGATNYFLWYDIPIPPIGNWTPTIAVGIITYTIIKHRLMDIRVAVGRTAVYVFSFGTVIGLGLILFYLNLHFLLLPIYLAGPLVLVIGILLFPLIFRVFEKLASRYFYYTFYSYHTVLTDLGKRLTRVLDLDKLSSLITDTLIRIMKLEKVVILLRELETGNYQIQKNIGFKEENGISLVKDNFLTNWLEKTKNPLVYEELSLAIRDAKEEEEKRKLEDLQFNMKKIEAALCLPLFIEDRIIGIIVLGNKLSGDPYSQQDIELLTTLSSQASIALQNAKLYDQIKDLSQNLEKKVKEQTKELQKAYEELKVLDRAKSEFISMASHQLRTPLSTIKGYISMLIEGSYGQIPEKAKEKLRNIFQSNERLIGIVNDLLDISKIELGKMELEKQPTQIEDLIQICFNEMQIEIEKKGLKFIFEKPKKLLPKINIDPLKIRQVILNLIDNAIKYTKKGEIKIKVEKKNSNILISVKDTGEGLTKEEKTRIFEGFTRGRAGINQWIQGVGLGLWVAKKYLELHQGKIWAESPGIGQGSTFFVELPIK